MRFDASGYMAANVGGGLMSEARDPAIKLFGRTIPLPETMPAPSPEDDGMDPRASSEMMPEMAGDEKGFGEEMTSTEHKGSTNLQQELVQGKPNTQDDKATLDLKPEEDQTESDGSGQGKVLKKPDKIVPCPRCNSLDTKFCYYNNYNVNQPRHFCKNCQRYWTAGGTMRNVPVGAGRRKNKHSASHYRQMTIPSDGQGTTRVDAPDSSHHAAPCLKENGTVLKFGPEGPLCESMASVLNLREQKRNVDPSPMACEEIPEEPSCASSVEVSNTPVQIEQNNGVTPVHHLPCYSGPPWPYPWGAPPVMATIPFPFTPASFWGFMPGWTWVGANGGFSSASSTSNSGCSSNGSQTLGKHSRDVSSQIEDKAEKSLWVPKTLRIDDPDEAAKSSIWATLGIKPDEGGIFKDLRFKKEGKGHASDSAQALLVNPAALSRSQSFREST